MATVRDSLLISLPNSFTSTPLKSSDNRSLNLINLFKLASPISVQCQISISPENVRKPMVF